MLNRHYILVLASISFLLVACQKKCQPPETEAFKTFTATKWRLVETTDPEFKKLNNTTFLVFEFKTDYTGQVNKVANNVQYETPVRTFIYNVELRAARGGTLRVKYQDPADLASEDGEEAPAPGDVPSLQGKAGGDVVDYEYELGRQFELTDSQRGYYYRMVPMKGIVEPDNECTF
jgi:hypothetical protein